MSAVLASPPSGVPVGCTASAASETSADEGDDFPEEEEDAALAAGFVVERTPVLELNRDWSFEEGSEFEDVPYSDLANPAEAFRVSLWVFCTGGTGFRSPLTSRDDPPCAGYLFYADPEDRWTFWVGDGENWVGTRGPQLVKGRWTLLEGAVDSASRLVALYVDGNLVDRR
eukprot:CAMPEP_0170310978 /NCGR_PEP_ID=MMETSP0116_2-20130129/55984_1 /TAXON_ID=400756 /ORGANISM="Durinskia baltica, Strain CSIRO CS-38" /LENGTH=170 /DNA_ID=CAMNT_0010563271 /DNA_START=23 /DNA_END=531 /DNA_ORIENTATION=+